MTTTADIIYGSLRLIGVLAEGETPSSETAQDALTAMNQMIDSWNTERLAVFSTQDQVVTWPPSTRSRTMGPTGDIVALRPVLVDDASYFRDPSSGISFGLKLINQQQYNGIAVKTVTSTYPQVMWVNMTYPNIEMYVYPVPIKVLEFHIVSVQELTAQANLGTDVAFDDLDAAALGRVAAIGAGFTGLLSLFNILGRFFWSVLSDSLGRKTTYALFFLLGTLLYAAVPAVGRTGSVPLFCGVLCLIITMYGGGFAAIPAYLADLFGSRSVGAIHGRLLTAWSVAGVLGPVLVNYVNEQQVRSGVPRGAAYDRTMILLAGLLAIGFVCNLLVRPLAVVAPEASGPAAASSSPTSSDATETLTRSVGSTLGPLVGLWLLVALPLAWGLWTSLQQAWLLFG